MLDSYPWPKEQREAVGKAGRSQQSAPMLDTHIEPEEQGRFAGKAGRI